MRRLLRIASVASLFAVLFVGLSAASTSGDVVTPQEVASPSVGFLSCGICSGPFFLNGQVCFFMSCNGGPCNVLYCLDF